MANYRKSIRVYDKSAPSPKMSKAQERTLHGLKGAEAQRIYLKGLALNAAHKAEKQAAKRTVDMRRKIAALPGLDDPMASPNYKVPTLDMPNMDMRSVRQIYQDLKKKKKLASKNSVPVKTDQAARRKIYDDARKRINGEKLAKLSPNMTTDQYVSALLIRVRELETRVTDLELESNRRVNDTAHLNARMDSADYNIAETRDRVSKLEPPTAPYTQDLDKKGKHVVPNEAAKSIYEIQKLLTNAVNALEQIRESKW